MALLPALMIAACSSAPLPTPDCNGVIFGASVSPTEPCLPPMQVWIREHALFDSPDGSAFLPCAYASWRIAADACSPIYELLAVCPLPDGYSQAAYHVQIDYAANGYLWKGAVRVPSGAMICEQSGGGMLEHWR